MSLEYLPSIKPSALAIGALYSHVSSFIVYGPLLGSNFNKAMQQDKNSEFWKREGGPVAITYVSSVSAAIVQTYGVAAILKQTGTVSYTGASYLGLLLLFISAAPSAATSVFVEKRPMEYVVVKAVSQAVEVIGLSLVLNWWGVHPIGSPFH